MGTGESKVNDCLKRDFIASPLARLIGTQIVLRVTNYCTPKTLSSYNAATAKLRQVTGVNTWS